MVFFTMKKISFRGAVSDISAQTATLVLPEAGLVSTSVYEKISSDSGLADTSVVSPENYIFLLIKDFFTVSKYPKNDCLCCRSLVCSPPVYMRISRTGWVIALR